MAIAFVGAGTGVLATTGACNATKTGCTAGNLLLCHLVVRGTSEDWSSGSNSNVERLNGGASNMDTVGSNGQPIGNPQTSRQTLFIGRVTASGTCQFGLTVGASGEDIFMRLYEFSGVSAGRVIGTVLENYGQGWGTGTTVDPSLGGGVDFVTAGAQRLAVCLIGVGVNIAIGDLTGEGGGINFTEAVAEYAESGGATGTLQLQTAFISTAGTYDPGTLTIGSSQSWGTLNLSLIPPSSTYSDVVLSDAPVAYYRMNEPTRPFSTAVLDDGFGSNETPIAVNWSGPIYPGLGQLRRISNTIVPDASTFGGSWYDISTFGPDCEAYVTLTSFGADGNSMYLYARATNVGTANLDAYVLLFEPRSGADFFRLYVETNGTDVLLASDDTISFSSGDIIGIRCIGSTIEAWRKPLADGRWARILSVTDGTWTSAGYLGLVADPGTFAFTNFGGGTNSGKLPQDSSGNGNHCTVIEGSPTFAQTGPIASDTTDAGILVSSSPNQNFRAPDAASLDVLDTFTYEAWINFTFTDLSEYVIVSKGYSAAGLTSGMYIQNKKLSGAQPGVGFWVESTTVLSTGVWYHCVVTKNGATRLTYINGVDVTNTGAQGNLTCQNGDQELGLATEVSFGSTAGSFGGTVAEVAIYNTELTAAEVLAHYQAAQEEGSGIFPRMAVLSGIGF